MTQTTDAALVERQLAPTKQTVIDTVAQWDDGVSGKLLVMRLVAAGYERLQAQRMVQLCLDRGLIHIGAGLRIRVGSAFSTVTP
jgi:hypothetical protein